MLRLEILWHNNMLESQVKWGKTCEERVWDWILCCLPTLGLGGHSVLCITMLFFYASKITAPNARPYIKWTDSQVITDIHISSSCKRQLCGSESFLYGLKWAQIPQVQSCTFLYKICLLFDVYLQCFHFMPVTWRQLVVGSIHIHVLAIQSLSLGFSDHQVISLCRYKLITIRHLLQTWSKSYLDPNPRMSLTLTLYCTTMPRFSFWLGSVMLQHKDVNVQVYGPDVSVSSVDCPIYTPGTGTHSFMVSSPLGKF